jgi:hypothetical protein
LLGCVAEIVVDGVVVRVDATNDDLLEQVQGNEKKG